MPTHRTIHDPARAGHAAGPFATHNHELWRDEGHGRTMTLGGAIVAMGGMVVLSMSLGG